MRLTAKLFSATGDLVASLPIDKLRTFLVYAEPCQYIVKLEHVDVLPAHRHFCIEDFDEETMTARYRETA